MMKFPGLLLSACLAVGTAVPAAALLQDEKPKPAPDPAPAAAGDDQTQKPVASQDEEQLAGRKDSGTSIKHPGGKDDVDAIGSRKVGGLDVYSIETEIKMGRAYAEQIERSLKLVDDPMINEYVNRIGQNLVRNSDAKIPFTIKVVDDDSINAMALPGGILYVNSGLILAADDEAELAGAMAHEIAHIALRHATRTMTRENIAEIIRIPVVILGGPIPANVAPFVLPVTFLKFSRGFEAEADYFGTQYMYKTGYDPNALVTFFEKIQARERKKPGTLSRAFATHPQTPDRIQKTQKEIAAILPPRDGYVETTSEFNEVKGRLATLRNQRKVDPANQPKPTLRKAGSSPTKENEEKKDDERPTLQRRYVGTASRVTEGLAAVKP